MAGKLLLETKGNGLFAGILRESGWSIDVERLNRYSKCKNLGFKAI